jgi:hypothetical protein
MRVDGSGTAVRVAIGAVAGLMDPVIVGVSVVSSGLAVIPAVGAANETLQVTAGFAIPGSNMDNSVRLACGVGGERERRGGGREGASQVGCAV